MGYDYKKIKELAAKPGTARALTTAFYDFVSKGDNLLGVFQRQETITLPRFGSDVERYVFDTEDGRVSCILGGATDKQLGNSLKPGDIVSIVYGGKKKIDDDKKEVNIFEVLLLGHVDGNK